MRIITANLPLEMIKAIKQLTGENGLYPSRSELIRVATRDFLIKELEAAKSFLDFQKKSQFSALYPPVIKEESKPKTVKVPLKDNSEGAVVEYKEYKIIRRCELNA